MSKRVPSFQTNEITPVSELPTPSAAIWRFKVTQVSVGGNDELLKCKACSFDGGLLSTREYIVRRFTDAEHAVNDLIFATMPRGGSDQTYNGKPVVWVELSAATRLPIPTAQNQVLSCTSYTSPTEYTLDFDWVKGHS